MPRGPKGERRPADVIGNAVKVMRIATSVRRFPAALVDRRDGTACFIVRDETAFEQQLKRDAPLLIERITQAILARSTEAVLTYREASGLPDNELPELFIASSIAVTLHRDLGLLCRCEYLYTLIAYAMCAPITDDLLKSIGELHADLALFDANQRPLVAVEVKVDADGRPPFAIVNDIEKLRKLARLCPVTPLVLSHDDGSAEPRA